MGKFRKIETPLKDVYVLEPTVFEDHRRFLWKAITLEKLKIK